VDLALRQDLAVLARCPRFRLWVISGRRQQDIRDRVHVPGIHYLGLHGWERRAGALLEPVSRTALECLRRMLGGVLVNHPSLWLEDKEHALTVHYRRASSRVRREAFQSIRAALTPFQDSLRLSRGKLIWEIIPHELEDKGLAVKRELASVAFDATPVYVGDDLVDEPAFAALARGVTVHVGRMCATRARYSLKDVGEVHRFLKTLRSEYV
jgi:trehalose-phosphatase